MNDQLPEVRPPAGELNLFGVTGAEMIVAAKAMADPLADLIKEQKLFTTIGNKDHVHVEGWQTLGAMLPNAVTAVIVGEPIEIIRKNDAGQAKVIGYRVQAEARLLDGRVIGAGWSECTTTEGGKWGNAKPHALLGMAQTRAMSRALKGPLGWVMQLAGYSPTPAEEVVIDPVLDGQADASPDYGDDPELADTLVGAARAATALDPVAWSHAKIRARLNGCNNDDDRREFLAHLNEWLNSRDVKEGLDA